MPVATIRPVRPRRAWVGQPPPATSALRPAPRRPLVARPALGPGAGRAFVLKAPVASSSPPPATATHVITTLSIPLGWIGF